MKLKPDTIEECVDELIKLSPIKIIISNPQSKTHDIKKIRIEKKTKRYHAASYTDKQVFHKNIDEAELRLMCMKELENNFLQLNAWTVGHEVSVRLSKKKKTLFDIKTSDNSEMLDEVKDNNRKKNYILKEGTPIEPLTDMGVFTKDCKVISSMYDKFKQINRFIELIDDELKNESAKSLNIIDFGCGKSYLTFVVYYYLTQIKGIEVNMIGLDLKEDVIKKCNDAAIKYNYDRLSFELGDINGYHAPFKVDMVITLHACDTATDYALYNAVSWGARYIFSVPCCQHELNSQIKSEELRLMTRYGIVKERFSALMTDAIRGNLLEYMGYSTKLLEFIDITHTPKNILIRAIKNDRLKKEARQRALYEVERAIERFDIKPTLYELFKEKRDVK